MDKIKVGIIGAWWRLLNAHGPSLAMMDDVEITAICDLLEGCLTTAADKFDVQGRFSDYKLMLKKTDLNAVYILMRPQLLDPVVAHCLNLGKNVFMEKPPGTQVEETRRWARLAEENDCKTMVGFQRRFHPCVSNAKKTVEERGKIMHCTASFHKWGESSHNYAWEDHLTHDVIHVVDLLRWLGGDVKNVHSFSAQLFNNKPNHLNTYTAILEYESGGIGILNANRNCGGRELYFEIHSKHISAYGNIPDNTGINYYTIRKDNRAVETVKLEELIEEQKIQPNQKGINPIYYGAFQENRHFIDCLKDGTQPLTNLQDAAKTMEVIAKILAGPRLSPVTG